MSSSLRISESICILEPFLVQFVGNHATEVIPPLLSKNSRKVSFQLINLIYLDVAHLSTLKYVHLNTSGIQGVYKMSDVEPWQLPGT